MEKLILEIVGEDRDFLLKALQEVTTYVKGSVSVGTVRVYENYYHWTIIKERADPPAALPDNEQQEGQS